MTDDIEETCPVCQKPFIGHDMGAAGNYQLAACTACGSVMTAPWMTQEEIDTFIGEVQPEIVHLPSPEYEIEKVKKVLKKIAPDGKGKEFLDVSARQGYAVMAAKELGYEAHGIDPYPFFTAFSKDKYDAALFENISLKDYAATGKQADVVFAAESFSEQLDPDGYAADLAKVLAPNGKLYIDEGDGNSFWLPKTFANWNYVNPPLNFCYLSSKGMKTLLSRHGLKIRKVFFPWTPTMRLVVTHK